MAYPNPNQYMQQSLGNGPPNNSFIPTRSNGPEHAGHPPLPKGSTAYYQQGNTNLWTDSSRPPQMNGEMQLQHLQAPSSRLPNTQMPPGSNPQANSVPQSYLYGSQSSNASGFRNANNSLPISSVEHGQSMSDHNGPSLPSARNTSLQKYPGQIPPVGSSGLPTANITKGASAYPPPPLPGQQYKSFTPPPAHPPGSHLPSANAPGVASNSSRSTPTHHPQVRPSFSTQASSGPSLHTPPFPGQQVSSTYQQVQYPTNPSPTVLQGSLLAPPLPGQQYRPPTNARPPPNFVGQPASLQNSIRPPPLPGQPCSPQQSARPIPEQQVPQPSSSGSQPSMPSVPGSIPPPLNQQVAGPSSQPLACAYPGQHTMQHLTNSFGGMGTGDAHRPINLMQETRILPSQKPVEKPMSFQTKAERGMLIPPNRKNCNPEVLRCTLKAIPHTQNLLGKVKLPFGLVVHPFKDLSSLPVISAGTIVRCKRCRTYVNPFVTFLDERRWRCNMCFSVNETPEEFLHHPVSKSYGEPHTRPECTNATIEFIAPQEYMLRPPQPAVYLFLLDVSHSAIESGYLQVVCDVLLENLDRMPGDSRTRIGFLTYNGTLHFYRLSEGLAQPQMMIISDIDDAFLPTPESLLVNLRESKSLVQDLLHQLPKIHTLDVEGEVDTYSALGAALEVAKKLMSPFGGRVTAFQQAIPSIGPGKLGAREDPGKRTGQASTSSLNPATDYYKKMALDCSAHQVAIDFFFFNSQFIDIATISCASRFSAGDLHYYPALHTTHNPMEVDRLTHDLERYLTRKIGFEAVMRIRCTKGLNIHTFHGNFFVRSTDLLSLANVNPDSGYAVNLSIEESLSDYSAASIQAALLYTTSKGERRIRVHTMCVPVVKTPAEVLNAVDCVAVVSLLGKMGVDRAVTASLSDARDALLNAVVDPLKSFKETLPQGLASGGVYVPQCLRLFPLYMQAMLKHPAFRVGVSTRLDHRVFAMINLKMQPAAYFMQDVHPDMYRVDDLNEEGALNMPDDNRAIPQPDLLPLTAESLSQSGAFLLDCGWNMFMLVGRQTSRDFIKDVLGAAQFSNIEEPMYFVPEEDNPRSKLFHNFIEWLQDSRPHHAPLRIIRDDSRDRHLFFSHLHQDRSESSMSLPEFLMHVQQKLA